MNRAASGREEPKYTGIFQPRQQLHKESNQNKHDVPLEQRRADLQMRYVRQTINEKFKSVNGKPCTVKEHKRHTSQESFRLKKEADYMQVKPYTRLAFSTQPVSVAEEGAMAQAKARWQQGGQHRGARPSSQRVERDFYSTMVQSYSNRSNRVFDEKNASERPRSQTAYQRYDTQMLLLSGIIR